MRFTFVFLSLAAALLQGVEAVPAQSSSPSDTAEPADHGYIVLYKEGIEKQKRDLHETLVHVRATNASREGIRDSFKIGNRHGYHVDIDPGDLDEFIHDTGYAETVERDEYINFHKRDLPIDSWGIEALRCGEYGVNCQDVGSVPGLWGLARLSHTTKGEGQYVYDKDADVSDMWAYVVDTGIQSAHNEFSKNQVVRGINLVGEADGDLNGHGTHVAGIIGGRNVGVAKGAKLVSVKVLDKRQSGRISNVVKGISWAVEDAAARGVTHKAIINMSFCGRMSSSMNSAVQYAHDAGILTIAAAGNEGDNTEYYSPASERSALVVGAMNKDDERPSWSNYGETVSIFAPGQSILSAWIGNGQGQPAYKLMSGTSMAAPHVSGMVLYLMSLTGVQGPQEVKDLVDFLGLSAISSNDGSGLVKNGMSPEALIAYNGALGLLM